MDRKGKETPKSQDEQNHRLTHTEILYQSSADIEADYHRIVNRINCLQAVITDGLCFLDSDWRIESINTEAERLLNIVSANAAGSPLTEVTNILSLDNTAQQLDESIFEELLNSSGTTWQDEVMMRRHDGTLFPAYAAINLVYQNEELVGAIFIFRDISQQKKLEENLLERTAEAEQIAERRAAQLLRSEDELKLNAIELAYQASHDVLTGLINRKEFEQQMSRMLTNTNKLGAKNMFLYVDLDQFKVINDSCGDIAGDELLRQLATLIKGKLRRWDILSRLGGDEFGALILYCTEKQAKQVAKNLLEAIKNHRFIWRGKAFPLTASVGLVPITETSVDIKDILSRGEVACFIAKEEGRDRTYVYQDQDEKLAQRNSESGWVSRINDAIDFDRFQMYSQSIVPSSTNEAKLYELLIRMLDDDGEVIYPGAFLPAAERYNLMPRIDRWVIKKTCTMLKEHTAALSHIEAVCINLSGQSLADDSLADYILEVIEQANIPKSKICFEVTETAAISNLTRASGFLEKMNSAGCRFALDDFGSGMSSFAYLKNLDVEFLKIDGMFVKDMSENEISHAMVKSIHEIGHVMGKKTIAEFVENDDIHKAIKELGIDYAQGFGLDKPAPFIDLLDSFD